MLPRTLECPRMQKRDGWGGLAAWGIAASWFAFSLTDVAPHGVPFRER
jgi:hypothetical protein